MKLLLIVVAVVVGLITQSCKSFSTDQSVKNKSNFEKISFNSEAEEFLKRLKEGDELSSLFSDNWTFIYHEDNRCDGSTDGQLDNLSQSKIDSVISIQVKNDGEGWACDKKPPSTFELEFSLKNQIKNWDRFEIPCYQNREDRVFYILGAGESDYVKIFFEKIGSQNLVVKLEYRSEDPG